MQWEVVKQLGRPKEDEAIYVQQTNIAQEWAQKADKTKSTSPSTLSQRSTDGIKRSSQKKKHDASPLQDQKI